MASYLIDFENVQGNGLRGLDSLGSQDKVFIFYSTNADKITFDLHRRLNETEAQIEYVCVKVGHKNALDFQLATYLGYLVANHADEHYFLVTKDNGFEAIATFWQDNNVKVELASNLTGRSKEAVRNELSGKVRDLVGQTDEIPIIVSYIQKYKTKSGLNNALGKKYGSQRAGEIYKAIKPLIADKKGSPQDGSTRRRSSGGSKSSSSNS
ncbi:MAG: PIN domain-containing protein [Coriobacteriales bacterium]